MSAPIHTYLDLDVVNNNLVSETVAPALRFEETRNTPFLEGDTSDYFCSIVRFSIQTGKSLPIFIPRIQTGQSDARLTVYKITTSLSDATGTYLGFKTITHGPADGTVELPQPPLAKQDMSSSYYYHYNISSVLFMFNSGLSLAWSDPYSKILNSPVAPADLAVAFSGLATRSSSMTLTSADWS